MQQNFRLHLREQTRVDHASMDQLFSRLDIAKKSDFITFARIHLSCFEAMARVEPLSATTRQMLAGIVAGLQSDLKKMQQNQDKIDVKPFGRIDPLAVDYVLGGSRMGTKLLRIRWSQSTDQNVKDANAYFNLPSNPLFWQGVCHELSLIRVGSERAKSIIRGTKQIFELFSSTCHNTMMNTARAD